MYSRSIMDLLNDVHKDFPDQAREVYEKSYNNALNKYESLEGNQDPESREAAAHKVAWNAVENKYEKGYDGRWHEKI